MVLKVLGSANILKPKATSTMTSEMVMGCSSMINFNKFISVHPANARVSEEDIIKSYSAEKI